MGNKTWKVLGVIGLYAVLAWNSPVTAKAAEIEVETSTTLYAKIDAPDVVVRKAKNAGGEAVTKVLRGQTYEVDQHCGRRGVHTEQSGDPDREDKGKSG